MATARNISRIAVTVFVLALSSVSHAQKMECQDVSERKASVGKMNKEIDWFLSIVEEVPEGVAQQFRAVDIADERALRNAFSHPLWRAHGIRDQAADVKDWLGITLIQTPDWRIKRAIMALKSGAFLMNKLSDYADANPGRRIIDLRTWSFNYTSLVGQLQQYALCLVDNRQ